MVLEEWSESISIAFKPPTIEVVAINDLADKKTMAHLLKIVFTVFYPQGRLR
jgi:glyceraldehyde-3-phosphate dehydrogenase/erythrose-4-phosphate dehydrogenase